MAVLFMDSAHGRDGLGRWTSYGPGSIQGGQSPSGRSVYRFTTTGAVSFSYPTPVVSSLTGWYGRRSVLGGGDASSQADMFGINGSSGTRHLTLTVTSGGAVRIRRGDGDGTILATSVPGVIGAGGWHYYEVRAEIEDTGGRAEVWVDGVQRVNFTGDTRNGGSDTEVGRVGFARVNTGGGNWDISDIRIGDDTTPIGVATVWFMLPDGNGTNIDLARFPDGGEDNWQNVDEDTPNGDTDYNFSDLEGDYDLYTYEDLPAGDWDVLAVQTAFNARVENGGAKALRPVIRSGAGEAQGTDRALTTGYLTYVEMFGTNPVTTDPWTPAEINSLEFGPEVRDV